MRVKAITRNRLIVLQTTGGHTRTHCTCAHAVHLSAVIGLLLDNCEVSHPPHSLLTAWVTDRLQAAAPAVQGRKIFS